MRRTASLLVLAAAACGGGTAAPDAAAPGGACTPLEGTTFASVTEGECGLGPNGPSSCTWHITFAAHDAAESEFMWQHSDYGVDDFVSCAGSAISGVTASLDYHGTYDASTQMLTWDDVAYVPM